MKYRFEENIKCIIWLFLLIIFTSVVCKATIVNGRILLESSNDSLYNIKLQINTETGTDKVGGATIVIKYDTAQIYLPDLPAAGTNYLFNNFSGGNYSSSTVTKVLGNLLWLNIELEFDNQGCVVAGKNSWTDVVTLYFTKRVQTPVQPITWETGSNFWSIYDANNSTKWVTGNFNNTTNIKDNSVSTDNYELFQNYPNPFNPKTTIRFNLKTSGDVVLTVYNILGKLVGTLVSTYMNEGNFKIDFDAANLPSGIYFYKLTVNNSFTEIKKMMLLK